MASKKISDITPLTELPDSAVLPVSVGDAKANTVTMGVLSQKVADKVALSDYEQVTIKLKKEDGTTMGAGLTVDVKVEGEETARTLTTDDNGECTTNVMHSVLYVVSYPEIEGYDVPASDERRSAFPKRTVEATYIEGGGEGLEKCTLDFAYMSSEVTKATVVKVKRSDIENAFDVEIDATTQQAVFSVPLGVTYIITPYDVDGAITPDPVEYVAEHIERAHKFYYKTTVNGVYWVLREKNAAGEQEIPFADATKEMFDNDEIYGLLIEDTALEEADCQFVIPRDVICGERGLSTYAWCSSNTDVPTIGYYTSHGAALADLNGEDNCTKIMAACTSQMCNYAKGLSYTFNGETLNCFVGSYKQMWVCRSNYSTIAAFISNVLGKTAPNVTSGYWWTSSQYSSSGGVRLDYGSFYNFYKNYSYSVLPLLAYHTS